MSKGKILITGATGFIGSHLCELALKKGFKVVAFDRYNINNDPGWLSKKEVKKEINLVLGDIRDYDSVIKAMKGCKSVMHLAALIGIPYSYSSPLAYLKTNVEGTYNILEAAKNLNINNIITTSTSEVYGSAQYTPIDESHPINAQSPYAASKASADQLALSYYRSFKLPVKILRPFNTYGPRQSNRAIIPSIINQCLKNKDQKIILGNTSPKRDFSYVSDTCESFFKVYYNKKLFGQIINSGTKSNISINDLAKKIFKIMKVNFKIRSVDEKMRPKLSEVNNLLCENKKMKKLTKWKPSVSLDEGLRKTIEWVKFNQSKYGDHYSL